MSDVASVQEEYVAELRAEIQQLRDVLNMVLRECFIETRIRKEIRAALAATPSEDTE